MKKALLAFMGLSLAALAMAQLSKYKDWGKSPEAYFLTPSEREEWSKVKTDEEAEKFVATYWAKRDPTPGTPQNEFKDAVMRRIAAADEQFKMRRYARGSESSRGRVFVTLGPPTRASLQREQQPSSAPGGMAGQPGQSGGFGEQMVASTATWTYEKDKFDPSWDIGAMTVRFSVDPQRGSDELINSGQVERAVAKIAEKSVVNPTAQATGAPAVAPVRPAAPPAASGATAPSQPPAAAPPATAAAPAVSATLPAATRASLEAIARESKEHVGAFWGGPFRTVTGDPFYAFEFYVPADKAPAGAVRFGGVVTNEAGQEVASFWEDATLADMKTGSRMDKVYERSIVLPAGSYRAALGLFPADGATAIVSSSAKFQIGAKTSEFDVSPLVLANTLTPLTKRPNPTDPFVFGMEKPIKVEPKGNHVFAKEDSLWYFYTVSNPTLAAGAAPASAEAPAGKPAATPAPAAPGAPAPAPAAAAEAKPRLMARIGVLKDGKPAFAPFTGPAEVQPLSTGYYATGSEIPLSSFDPGYYTFQLNIRDLNAPRDSAAFKGIDRKEDFVVLKPDGSMPEKAAAEKPAPKPTARPKAPAKKG